MRVFTWLLCIEGSVSFLLHGSGALWLKNYSPHFSSGVSEYDDAFDLALSEVVQNTNETDSTLNAGPGWPQMWTRDSAYTVSLAGGLLDPKACRASFSAESKNVEVLKGIGPVWRQDKCGHFGPWPFLSDSIVGALGAWSLYTVTGDHDFLRFAHNVTKNTLRRAERDVYDKSTGLFRGVASFMESNSAYPEKYWWQSFLVGETKALSTNMLYYMGYKIAALMGQTLGTNRAANDAYERAAAHLRRAIRSRFWHPGKGYYAYVEDEKGVLFEQMEGLGESLVLLAPDFENDTSRIESIFQNTYRSARGIPCLWPPFEDRNDMRDDNASEFADYYHNGRVWPFVQGYWAVAAARHGRGDIMMEEMAKLVASSQLQGTFAEFYNLNGTFLEGHHRQLWSDAGFLSMVYQGIFGMVFEKSLIRFKPLKPKHPFAETISLTNVQYRAMTLDVHLTGSGSKIDSFQLDGRNSWFYTVSDALKGAHTVNITLTE